MRPFVTNKGGDELHVLLSVWPLFDRDGSIIGISTVTHDITEQALAREAETSADLLFQAAFRRSLFGMMLADLDAYPTTVNRAICELLGRRSDELLNHRWGHFSHPDDAHLTTAMLADFRSGADSFSTEQRFVRPDDTVIWLQSNVNVVHDATDRPLYLMAQMQDITDRKSAEAEVAHRALHDELTGCPNRTLLNDRLEHALAATERSQRQIGLMFLDLDNFKQVNDSLGHSVGDRLLVDVGRRLDACIRPGDTVARFGGTNSSSSAARSARTTSSVLLPGCSTP